MEFLRFLDGQKETEKDTLATERHQALLDFVAKAAVVSTDRYDEKRVFKEYFQEEPTDATGLPATSDADVDFDYSDVQWEAPSEDEMAILQRMLADNEVSIPASALQMDGLELPPGPMEEDSGIAQIEADREWV